MMGELDAKVNVNVNKMEDLKRKREEAEERNEFIDLRRKREWAEERNDFVYCI